MPLSLRDYSMPELEALLRDIEAALGAAEEAERALAAPVNVVAAALPPDDKPAIARKRLSPRPVIVPARARAAEPAPALKALESAVALAVPALEPPAPLPIKYMHPANRNMTWTGEGPQPLWMTAYFAHGGSWSALENTAAKLAPRKR